MQRALYDDPARIEPAADRIAQFFEKNLPAS